MILFMLIGAAVVMAAAVTVAMPLWHGGRRAAAALQALAFALLASLLYALLGAPEQIDPGYRQQRSPEQLFADLRRYLRSEGSDASGWKLLADVGMHTGRYEEAASAYGRLIALEGEQPELLLGRADALAMAAGGKLDGEPEQLLNRALLSDPDNAGALWMLSMSAHSQGRREEALDMWQRLWPLVADDRQKLQLRDLISAAGGELPPMLALHISISQGAEPPDPSLPVFVFARAPSGPARPVAVLKRSVSQLPMVVVLDDADVISAGDSIGNHEQLMVSARVAAAAGLEPAPGDLVATPVLLSPGQYAAIQLVPATLP